MSQNKCTKTLRTNRTTKNTLENPLHGTNAQSQTVPTPRRTPETEKTGPCKPKPGDAPSQNICFVDLIRVSPRTASSLPLWLVGRGRAPCMSPDSRSGRLHSIKSKESTKSACHLPQLQLRSFCVLERAVAANHQDSCTILPASRRHRSKHHHGGQEAEGTKIPSQVVAAARRRGLDRLISPPREAGEKTRPLAPWRNHKELR